MGYESKLVFGYVYEGPEENGMQYLSPLATVDLGKTYFVSGERYKVSDQRHFWYEGMTDDGTELVVDHDPYADPLLAIDMARLLDDLKSAPRQNLSVGMRMAIPMLEEFMEFASVNQSAVDGRVEYRCVHYGH